MGVILDGQKTRNAYNHLHKAELLWEHELGVTQDGKQGLVNFCDKDKKLILLGDEKRGIAIPPKDTFEKITKTVFEEGKK